MAKENSSRYLQAERSGLQHLRFRDILLATAVADIHRHTVKKKIKKVPLRSIRPLRCLDRESAPGQLEGRVQALREQKDEIRRLRILTRERLLNYLPSVSGIKVIRDGRGGYISFEGSGGVEALRRVFAGGDRLNLEVEIYYVDRPGQILRRVRRVQSRNFNPYADSRG